MSATRQAPCPCGLPALYAACCGRYHGAAPLGAALPTPRVPAPTAEALMRSRYSAHVLGRTDYLLSTWHPSTRPLTLKCNPPELKWLGLDLRRAMTLGATLASVEFVARSKLGGRAERLHELSRFVFEDGRWFYLDGEIR